MRALVDLLFPPRCPFCRGGVERHGDICPDCQRSLPWLTGQKAERTVDLLEGCAGALGYDGAVRECIHRFKFGRKMGYAKTLGPLAAQCAADHFPQSFDLISWPPLSAKGLRRRGYDQARLLAHAVAESRGMAETPLLKKKNATGQQSLLQDHAARRANVLGAYSLAVDPEVVRDKHILLVDDVVTSGATLSECARVLLTAGAAGVWAVSLAVAQRR